MILQHQAWTCPADFTIDVDQLACTGSTALPAPVIVDVCSGFTFVITADNGLINNAGDEISDLPPGVTTVTVTAIDDCNNESSCSYTITVEDMSGPLVVCETTHTVALTNSDPTLVPAIVFNDGSLDPCGILIYEVRRLEGTQCLATDATTYGPNAPFYCCDIGEIIQVELRVTDLSGNSSSCITEVTVQDNMIPEITFCPADVTLDCAADVNDLTLTGEAIASDNCENIIPTYSDEGVLTCGTGEITRTWSVTDAGGNTVTCTQTITFQNPTPFFITDTGCSSSPLGLGHSLDDGVEWPCPILDATVCSSNNAPTPEELEAAGYSSEEVRPQLFVNDCEVGNVLMSYQDSNPITGPGFL